MWTLIVQKCYLSRHLLLALVIAAAFALWVQAPRIIDPFQVEEDFRNLYWVRLFQDNNLFQTDLYVHNHTLRLYFGRWSMDYVVASPVYGLLFFIASPIVDPLLFSKLLIFPLLLASVYFIYRIGERSAGKRTALAMALAFTVINLASHSAISVTGGLQRSFSMPLILGLVYYLMREQYGIAAFFILLGGLIYAPLFPLGAGTYCLSLLAESMKKGKLHLNWRRLTPLILASILILLALSPRLIGLARHTQAEAAEMLNQGEHNIEDPTFGRHGRSQLFHLFPVFGRGGFASGNIDAFHMVLMAALALLIWLIRSRKVRPFPPVLKHLLLSSIINFSLAWIGFLVTSAFPLYLPSRYTQATFILLLTFFIVLNGEEALRISATWLSNHGRTLTWPLLLVALLAATVGLLTPGYGDAAPPGRSTTTRAILVILCVTLVLLTVINHRRVQSKQGTGRRFKTGVSSPTKLQWRILGAVLLLIAPIYIEVVERDFYNPSPAERDVYQFLKTLPENTVVGGAPCILDGVPIYSKRQVTFSCDRLGPSQQLILDSILAYYAEDFDQVAAFCGKYGADVLVVDGRHFAETTLEESLIFFEPYHSLTYPTIANREQFVLEHVNEEARLFESGDLSVVACSESALAQK